ncbi:MAG: type II toxin-antitoxin system RelE/ParE family toxin [Deltaproteobacteria bacterium]|nr:type II toxin-antitoxin system RelE/ParE family toxin [Deltaproteobacteria bacterium]
MEVRYRRLKSYVKPDGKCPFEEWFETLRDRKTRAVIDARLIRIRQGNFGNCRTVGGKVREIKIDYGPGYRIYFAEDGEEIIVLLCGGDKSSQQRDIEKAIAYWAEYQG